MSLRRPPLESLTVDDLRFAVRWSARRRTIGITVKRDGELVVAAPRGPRRAGSSRSCAPSSPGCAASSPSSRRSDRRPSPSASSPASSCRIWAGSTRSTLADRPPQPVALRGDALEVDRALDGDARAAVVAWYEARAREYVDEAVARYVPLVGAAPAAVVVRDLGKRRWGVCDHRTLTVSFHWQLITQPPELVDYVVVHELAHLHEPNHGPGFWRRVEDVLPDCKERRKRLSRRGDQLAF